MITTTLMTTKTTITSMVTTAIAGTITDTTGAVLPGATVRAVNEATGNFVQGAQLSLDGLRRTAVTDTQGRFLLGALPPGDYLFRVMSYTDKTQDGKPLVSQNGNPKLDFSVQAETAPSGTIHLTFRR